MESKLLKSSLVNKIKIEKVRKKDLEKLIKVYEEAYKDLKDYAEEGYENILKYLNWLYKQDKEGFFVAKLNDEIIGFICADKNWTKDRGEIHEFVVSPKYQGLGIGKKLFETALNYLRKSGKKCVGLWVGEKNEKAKSFYKKYGFEYKGKIKIWEKYLKKFEEVDGE